jgi:hypothetical protein
MWLSLLFVATMLASGGNRDDSADAALSNAPPELARFEWMVGEWQTMATYRFGPELPEIKARSVQRVHWSGNKQFLISEQDSFFPLGRRSKLVITAWDETQRAYRLVDVDPIDGATELSMTVENNVRKIVYERRLSGRQIHTVLIMTQISDDEYTSRAECTDAGKTWVYYESKSKKIFR